jgi:hypothetical protein
MTGSQTAMHINPNLMTGSQTAMHINPNLMTGSQTAMHINITNGNAYKQTIKNLHRFTSTQKDIK